MIERHLIAFQAHGCYVTSMTKHVGEDAYIPGGLKEKVQARWSHSSVRLPPDHSSGTRNDRGPDDMGRLTRI